MGGDDAAFEGGLGEDTKELIEFGLQGGAGLIEQEEDGGLEVEMALPGEILWAFAVGIDEIAGINQVGYILYNLGSFFDQCCQGFYR